MGTERIFGDDTVFQRDANEVPNMTLLSHVQTIVNYPRKAACSISMSLRHCASRDARERTTGLTRLGWGVVRNKPLALPRQNEQLLRKASRKNEIWRGCTRAWTHAGARLHRASARRCVPGGGRVNAARPAMDMP